MVITAIDDERMKIVDLIVNNYSRENYSSALEYMGILWAFYRTEEKLQQMVRCDNVILRLINYARTKDTLNSVHWRGTANARDLLSKLHESDLDPAIKKLYIEK